MIVVNTTASVSGEDVHFALLLWNAALDYFAIDLNGFFRIHPKAHEGSIKELLQPNAIKGRYTKILFAGKKKLSYANIIDRVFSRDSMTGKKSAFFILAECGATTGRSGLLRHLSTSYVPALRTLLMHPDWWSNKIQAGSALDAIKEVETIATGNIFFPLIKLPFITPFAFHYSIRVYLTPFMLPGADNFVALPHVETELFFSPFISPFGFI